MNKHNPDSVSSEIHPSVSDAVALDDDRVTRLGEYLQGLAAPGTNGQVLFEAYKTDLAEVTPHEVMDLFNRQLESGVSVDQILVFLDKAINVLHLGLREYRRPVLTPGSFLTLLQAENDGLTAKLDGIRQLLLTRQLEGLRPTLRNALQELQAVNHHYLKKENILFPMLEKQHARFSGLAIMWALQDRARQILQKVRADFEDENLDEDIIRVDLGQIFFVLQGLINKENLILFPIAAELLTTEESAAMLAQCRDYEPAFMNIEDYEQFLAAAIGSHLHSAAATGDLLSSFF